MALEFVAPEFYIFIGQSSTPPALKIIEGRYLFLSYTELTMTDATFFPAAGGMFNILKGQQSPVFPEYKGAFIYDIKFQKWGQMTNNTVESA